MLIMEPAFLLMYYGGFTWRETQHMPVSYKRWFIERINREFSRTSENGQVQSRAAHQNTPDVRQLMGRSRDNVPSRLRRFT
jgi:hypothetical protein